MPYIKKLVMHGFKSFANKTEILFENSMNVVVGPNGSGKSNVTDALCFVLGRLSIKSIRAAKAANLLFSGNKAHKAANEAVVELVFDNSDRVFGVESNEVIITRILRKNGQSIYKINKETKTRQELLELLAQAGVDPNGFNIILQGEINSLIKINPEERRKIIEEVAGISIYETRKEKSLHEIEKTDEKLKEVSAVLKEKSSYLRNLEKERQDALNYQKLETLIKRCKASLLNKDIKEKEKEIGDINNSIGNQNNEIEKIKKHIHEKNDEISELERKISQINKLVQSSTNNEQESLHKEISELKAQIAGFIARKENFELRLDENKNKKQNLDERIKVLEKEISEIKVSSPEIKKQQEKSKDYQERFDLLEKNRRRFYVIKSELATLENRKSERQKSMIELKREVEIIETNISSLSDEIVYAKSFEKATSLKQETKQTIEKIKEQINSSEKENLELEKENAILLRDISREDKLKQDIVKLDICPLCKSKITQQHLEEVISNSNKKIESFSQKQKQNDQRRLELQEKISSLKNSLSQFETKLNSLDMDIMKLKNAEEKKNQIKKLSATQEQIKIELSEITLKISTLIKEFDKLKNVEADYDETRLKIQEISLSDVDVDTEVAIKQRELNRFGVEIKSLVRDIEESQGELNIIVEKLSESKKVLFKKEESEQELYEKFQKYFNDKNSFQDKQKAIETAVIGLQHTIRNYEDKNNLLKIQKAQVEAKLDSFKYEFKEFESFELMHMPFEQLKERLSEWQIKFAQIGSVNLKALEVYETVKQQCEQIQEKVQTIEKEKEEIYRIILEIDKKKRKAFMQTLEAINAFFTRNFSQLSRKGEVFLDLENKQNPFEGGLNIIVKVGKGKYFDITSLSGGEKTLVAISLIFAIQEYNPYCFYILDEIDSALDKNNSEILAALIKKYMVSGQQYIIITHNDSLITEASTLYGVSMQDNISKVVSLKI
ncbi:MAG: chromosome segregation SMC family protein [Nanoarchaeota archaeon]|nr:chromosome segregation SMC family protein [Nanoarchaeota archaeon]